jgi:GT2 family glycosyltransferase
MANRSARCQLSSRLYPSLFEHLPSIADELAKGHFVLLSPAAAEGLAPGQELPPEVLLPSEPTPATLADKLAELHAMGWAKLEQARKALCAAVVSAERGPERQRRLDQIIGALSNLINGDLAEASLASAARLLLDRKRPVADIVPPMPAAPAAPTLTVAVICHEMGALLAETVHSVWNASRLPDEVILVDDGSYGDETLATIAALEAEAGQRGLPLRIIRQTNQGLASARNAALAAASGGYISFIDGDDLIEPDFYGAALATSQANPGLGGVAAWAVTFGDGVPPGFWNAPQAELPLLFVENTIFVPCMMPAALLRELGGYDVTQRFNYEDWELSVRLLARGWPIVTIPRYMQRYRVRADSLLRTMSDVQNQVMRELFLMHHRDAAERFAPEIAMQIEHQLMKLKEEHAALQRRQTVVEQLKPVVRTTRARLFRGLARFKGASGS